MICDQKFKAKNPIKSYTISIGIVMICDGNF